MKTKCFITILFCFIFFEENFAQTWPMPGAHWEYCRGGAGKDFRIFEYTKDTTINTAIYQVIAQVNVSPSFANVGPIYTRYSNDTVYRYVQSKEYPFLVFNASLDDVYTTFRTNLDKFKDSTCSSILPVKVLKLDTLSYGTLSLRKWVLQDTLFNDIYFGFHQPSIWHIIERIGFKNDFPFTLNVWYNGNNCYFPSNMGGGYHLLFYSDNTYNHTFRKCDWAIGIEEKVQEKEFNIYPNPASDELTVSLLEITTPAYLVVYNIWGQEDYHSYLSERSTTLSIEKLPIGFYFLKCTSPEYTLTKTFIIDR